MIRSMTVINYLGESITFELRKRHPLGFEVHGIDGLGPVKGTINQSKISTKPGVRYNSSTVDGRNIVLQLGLFAAPTVEEARQQTYRYFPVTQEVTMLIETDNRIVTTTGRVESNEPPIFGKSTESQISILCDDAYLYDASDNAMSWVEFFGMSAGFEFPFSNESLTEPLLEFGLIEGIFSQVVNYTGDAEVGVTITATIKGDVENLILYNEDTNESVRIDHNILVAMVGDGLMDGDTVVIVTDVGNKSATLIRGGERINILNALGRNVNWLKLRKGPNRLTFSAEVGQSDVQIILNHVTFYEGV